MQNAKERGRIGRTFYKTYCDCWYIDGNNEVRPLEYVLDGYYNDAIRAQTAIAKELGQTSVAVKNITHKSFYASMPVESFLELADFISEDEIVE